MMIDLNNENIKIEDYMPTGKYFHSEEQKNNIKVAAKKFWQSEKGEKLKFEFRKKLKGRIPWNKGTKGLQTIQQKEAARERFINNNPSKKLKNRKKIKERFSGNKNHRWSGNNPSKRALHKRIKKQLHKPKGCYICSSKKFISLVNL